MHMHERRKYFCIEGVKSCERFPASIGQYIE